MEMLDIILLQVPERIQIIILTITSSLIILFNANIVIISFFNLYFNGTYLKNKGEIRADIRRQIIVAFIKCFWCLFPSYFWLVEHSYLVVGFWQSLSWALWHLIATGESYLANRIGCKVGKKSCKEIRQELLLLREKYHGSIATI